MEAAAEKNIKAKVAQVFQRMPALASDDGNVRGDFVREMNELLRKQAEAQERALLASIEDKSEKLNEITRFAEKKRVAIANANVKFSTMYEDMSELSEQVNKVTNWENEEDLEEGRGMRRIKSWKEDLEKIVLINRSLKEIVINYDILEEDISLVVADALVNNISDEVYNVVKAIEDDKRDIFSLNAALPDIIKLPIFEGRDDEDSVFKEKLEKVFIKNRISKADQLPKLKDCLRGKAKKAFIKNRLSKADNLLKLKEYLRGNTKKISDLRLEAQDLQKVAEEPISFFARGGEGNGGDKKVDEIDQKMLTGTNDSEDDVFSDQSSVNTDFGGVDDLSHPGGDQTCPENDVVRRVNIQYQNADEDSPRTTDRAARSLLKLFNVDDLDWQSNMAEVERMVFDLKVIYLRREEEAEATTYTMNHTGEGLSYRLVANSGYDRPKREVGVQHRPFAKIARSKQFRLCEECCSSTCVMISHEKDVVSLEQLLDIQGNNFVYMMYRSWVDLDDYTEELVEEYARENDEFMAMLCTVNTDFCGDDDLATREDDDLVTTDD